MKSITPLLPTCVLYLAITYLYLAIAGCKSDSPVATDAATTDAPATRDVPQPDAATDGFLAHPDLAPNPADAPSQPDVTLLDAASDLRASALDVAVEVAVADAPSSGEVSSDATCGGWTALKRLSAAEVSSLLATSDPIVINVHYPYAGDIPGTDTSIHYDNVDAIEAYLHYDHCADVVLICLSGGMSQSAGNELVKRGYLRVRDLNGGMQAWEAAGYTLLKDGGT